jgi:phage head maturation protease
MSDQIDETLAETIAELNTLQLDSDITVRSMAAREVDVRVAPFDVVIDTMTGPEVIERGAFRSVNPPAVLLMGLEHEVHLGADQTGKIRPVRRPMGRAIAFEERHDGAYATFRVSKTASGDEFLELANDQVVTGVSVELGRNQKVRTETRNGRRTSVVTDADLRAVAPTYHPAYASAQVLAMRAEQEVPGVATENEAATAAPEPEEPAQTPELKVVYAARSDDDRALVKQIGDMFGQSNEKLLDRLDKIEERGRMGFELPHEVEATAKATFGQWAEMALKILTGERIPDSQYRTVADLITSENAGVVPDAFVGDRIIGVIDPRRPFWATTATIPVPAAGMQLTVPKIVTRPTVAKQTTEKSQLSSTDTSITTESFNMQTYGGVGDISLQLLKRSDPSFLELYLRLLAEAYAIETEEAAVASLIAAVADGGPEPATALNPNSLSLGAAFQTSFAAIRKGPDTFWMSSEAVGEFIDAKATTTNVPLYANISANFDVPGGITGTIQGLRAVHVPALDSKGCYGIVGPSDGFAHAEDGTFTLQVDVPSKAGRDVALVGMIFLVPWYPEAFTLYNIAS